MLLIWFAGAEWNKNCAFRILKQRQPKTKNAWILEYVSLAMYCTVHVTVRATIQLRFLLMFAIRCAFRMDCSWAWLKAYIANWKISLTHIFHVIFGIYLIIVLFKGKKTRNSFFPFFSLLLLLSVPPPLPPPPSSHFHHKNRIIMLAS